MKFMLKFILEFLKKELIYFIYKKSYFLKKSIKVKKKFLQKNN
jgi:hypothetical protein